MVFAHVREIAIDDLGGGVHPALGADVNCLYKTLPITISDRRAIDHSRGVQ
jgi:hypothetical protein